MIELPIRTCKMPGCDEQFRAKRHDQGFCSSDCRKRFWRIAAQRGRRAYELLIEWRATRGKKGLLGDVAAEVDRWIAEDKKK